MEFVQPQKVNELIDAIFDPDVIVDPDFAGPREIIAVSLLLILSRRALHQLSLGTRSGGANGKHETDGFPREAKKPSQGKTHSYQRSGVA